MKPVEEWNLGERQQECIEKLGELGCVKLVCRTMGITESTYRAHLRVIKKKSGLKYSTQAVVIWDRYRTGRSAPLDWPKIGEQA